jgi:glycosyltransferase involved in cell wall biosynthesis
MAPKKICILSDHHICVNPRVWKEAFAYEKMGYQVVILTKWQNNEHKQMDFGILQGHQIDYKCFLNLIPGHLSPLKRFYYRLRKRLASECQRYFKIGGAWAINHAPDLLYRKALEERADFYSAHLESGFYAGMKLVNSGKKVSFDFEDWYSRDFLTPDRAIGLLKKIEHFAIHNSAFCTAASETMAKALQSAYQSFRKPEIIYNSFPSHDSIATPTLQYKQNNRPQIVWTSRTIGPNRGIEIFLRASRLISEPFDFHLVGECTGSYREFLLAEFPYSKGHNLIIHPFIKHDQLLQTISTYDIGLAIENSYPSNKNVTVSNKMLQYIQAGLCVLATDTEGQKEVAKYFPESVKTVRPNDPENWAQTLELMFRDRNKFSKNLQQDTYETFFSWEKQEQIFINLIKKYL